MGSFSGDGGGVRGSTMTACSADCEATNKTSWFVTYESRGERTEDVNAEPKKAS